MSELTIEYEYSVTGKKPGKEEYLTLKLYATDCAKAWRKYRDKYPEFKVNTKMVRVNNYHAHKIESKSNELNVDSIIECFTKSSISEDLVKSVSSRFEIKDLFNSNNRNIF